MESVQQFFQYFIEFGGYQTFLLGLKNTLIIAIAGLLIGFILGSLSATVILLPYKKWAGKILNGIINVYVTVFRGTPMVVQLLLLHFAIFPMIGLNIPSTWEAALIFGLNSGAYMSEIIRSGVNGVDPGQMEAARCVGLSYWESMVQIILPQAVKNILPTIGNEFITLLKDTSIVSFIAVTDITASMRAIAGATYEYFIPYIFLAIVYLVMVLLVTFLLKRLEKRFKKNERHRDQH